MAQRKKLSVMAWTFVWRRSLWVIAGSSCLWLALATAQPVDKAPLSLDPIVVSATIAPTPLSQSAASITVISREQIDSQQARSVTDLLRQVPGLHIDQAGGRGSVSSIYTRGGDPNFTVVLIDGIKVNDPTNSRGGSFDFSTLSPENIERIEIVSGPLSAVYGSDALSGVINIITRQGSARPERHLEAAGGRYAYWRVAGDAQGAHEALDYAVNAAYVDNGEPVEGSSFTNLMLSANVGLVPADTVELRWNVRYTMSDTSAFPDDSGGPKFAEIRDPEHRDIEEFTSGLKLTHVPVSWWEYSLQFSLYRRQEGVHSPGVAPGIREPIPPNNTDNTFLRYELTQRNVFPVFKGLQFAVGAQAQFEDGTSTGSLDLGGFLLPTNFALQRDSIAPFLEAQFSLLPGLVLQAGIRADFPEDFDPEVSPRVSAAYTFDITGTTLRASWGEGFKLPSFFALGHPIVGNANLQPETSESVDAGITQELWGKRLSLSATYFYNVFTDLIDFEETSNSLVNRSKVTTEGVELSLRVEPWVPLSFLAHLTYLTSAIQGTTEPLRNRPEWRGGFSVRWRPLPGLDLTLKSLVVGEVPDSSIPTGDVTLDAYARFDLAASYTWRATWKVFLDVENLFDANYQEFAGFPAPGINPRLGVQARF